MVSAATVRTSRRAYSSRSRRLPCSKAVSVFIGISTTTILCTSYRWAGYGCSIKVAPVFVMREGHVALSRRDFLKASSLFALQTPVAGTGTIVNDIHSQLNPTRVRDVVSISSAAELQRALRRAASARQAVSIAGGRHAMGAQQFAQDSLLLDMTKFNRVHS